MRAALEPPLQQIHDFLGCITPASWVKFAVNQKPLLLLDHAHCEKKAASTALSFIFRYPNQKHLLQPMSRFAREELGHFEKVLDLMRQAGVEYAHLTPSRYAGALREKARQHEPDRLIDLLIISAFIEARSCERFERLIPVLEGEMKKFYRGLLAAEARHFQIYLALARETAGSSINIDARIEYFKNIEASLITQADPVFRFHSGVPAV